MSMTPEERDTLIDHMFQSCQSAKGLTTWEMNFLLSIAEQWEDKRRLSDKQFAILERIYAEKTA